MKITLVAVCLTGIARAASEASGGYYLGASQYNIEAGISSEKLNVGLGARAFAYDVDRPSRFSSNGDLELTGYYIQKRFGLAKLQLGHSLHWSFVRDRRRDRFDYGSDLGLLKTGIEASITGSIGAYWDCTPIYFSNFNLFEWGEQDFNRIFLGFQNHKIGIRLYL